MGNRRNRRFRRLENPSPSRKEKISQAETPMPGDVTLTNSNVYDQQSLSRCNSEKQLTELSQISDEIQVWTQIMEQKINDRITKM